MTVVLGCGGGTHILGLSGVTARRMLNFTMRWTHAESSRRGRRMTLELNDDGLPLAGRELQ
jgi:hypothetical protein